MPGLMVMAAFAKRLPVAFIPKQPHVAPVRDDVVKVACVSFPFPIFYATSRPKRAADFDFWGDTPTPEFCENSHERGPQSPAGTAQGFDPPLGAHRSAAGTARAVCAGVKRAAAHWRRCASAGAARAVFGAFRGGSGEGAAGGGRGAARPGHLPVAGARRAARAKWLHPARLM